MTVKFMAGVPAGICRESNILIPIIYIKKGVTMMYPPTILALMIAYAIGSKSSTSRIQLK